MSNRYMLHLYKNDEELEQYQLFGNNDYFDYFNNYLESIGVDTTELEEYDSFPEVEIPDIVDLVRFIDKTIFHDIIKPTVREHPIDTFEQYSKFFDFSRAFYNGRKKPFVSLYGLAEHINHRSYISESYSMVEWLNSHNALSNRNIDRIKHNYLQNYDYVIIGELKPEYKLTISYS